MRGAADASEPDGAAMASQSSPSPSCPKERFQQAVVTIMSHLPPGWKPALSTTRVGDVYFYHSDGGGTTTVMPTPQTPTDIPNWYPAMPSRKAGAAPVTPALQPRAVAPEESAGTPPLAKVPRRRHPPETPAVAKSPFQGRPVSPSRSEISRGVSKSASLGHVPTERVGAARAAGMTPTQPPTPPPAKLGAVADGQRLSAGVFVGNSAMPKPTFPPVGPPPAAMPGVRFFVPPFAGDMGGTGGIMGVRMGGHGAIMGSMGVGGGTGYSTMSDGFLDNLPLSGGHGSMAVAGFPVLDLDHQEEEEKGFPDGFMREGGGGNRPNSPADMRGYRPY